jgi:hypothetical protein
LVWLIKQAAPYLARSGFCDQSYAGSNLAKSKDLVHFFWKTLQLPIADVGTAGHDVNNPAPRQIS